MTADTDQSTDALQDPIDGFHLALEGADVGLWRWDIKTGAVVLSPRGAGLLGRSPTQPLDYAGFITAIHPSDRPIAERALRTSLAKRAPRNSVVQKGHFDFEARAAATGRWLRVRGQAFDGESAPAEAAGILIDAGRRTAIDGTTSRLAAIVASSEDAIIGETLDGIMTDWNSGAEAILGYTAAEAIGRPLSILLPPGQEDE